MQTITWIGIVVIVSACSFFLGGWFNKKRNKQEDLEHQVEQAQTELAQYRQDVADHLDNTNKLMSKIKENYEQLLAHSQRSEKLLTARESADLTQPFFSKETTEQLYASLDQRPERQPTRRIH